MATQWRTMIKHCLKVYQLSIRHKTLVVWLEIDVQRRWFSFQRGDESKYCKKFTILSMDECKSSQASKNLQILRSRIRRHDLFISNDILLYNDDTFDLDVVYKNPKISRYPGINIVE